MRFFEIALISILIIFLASLKSSDQSTISAGQEGSLLEQIGSRMQKRCVDWAPKSELMFFYTSLVCGENLPPSKFRTGLQQSGLIHIFVVSGAHLILLDQGLSLVMSLKGRFFILLLYCFFSGFQPPVVRSLIQILNSHINLRFSFFMSSLRLSVLSGVLTLFLFPKWVNSLSFLLSWYVSVILSSQSRTGKFEAQMQIWFLSLPILAQLGTTHPISIVYNYMLGPIIGACFFPLALLAFAIPGFSDLSDAIFYFFVFAMNQVFPSAASVGLGPVSAAMNFFWLLHIAVIYVLSNLTSWRIRSRGSMKE